VIFRKKSERDRDGLYFFRIILVVNLVII